VVYDAVGEGIDMPKEGLSICVGTMIDRSSHIGLYHGEDGKPLTNVAMGFLTAM
jgi:hypothetical protein